MSTGRRRFFIEVMTEGDELLSLEVQEAGGTRGSYDVDEYEGTGRERLKIQLDFIADEIFN